MTLIDQVPAADKPTGGVKFHVIGYSNGIMEVDAADDDTLINVPSSTSTSTTITTNNGSATGSDIAGTGVAKLTIKTNDLHTGITDFYPNGGTKVQVPSLTGTMTMLVQTGDATYATVNLGGADDSSVFGLVQTGAGHDVVNLSADGETDNNVAITVDFGAGNGSGNGLGLHNVLNIHVGGTATLTRSGGTDVVDAVNVLTDQSNIGGTLIVTGGSTIGDLDVQNGATALIEASLAVADSASTAGTFTVESGGTTDITADTSVTGTMTVSGTATVEADADISSLVVYGTITYTSTAGGSSAGTFDVENGNADLGAAVTVTTFEVVGGSADVFLEVSQPALGDMTISGGGVVTLQQRSGTPSVSIARSMIVSSLSFGSPTLSGTLDITDNDLVVDYTGSSPIGSWNGSHYTGIAGYIQSGRNGGSWDGEAIFSSLASTSGSPDSVGVAESSQVKGVTGTQTAVFDSATVDSTAVLVKYTYGGDATLDGKIDISDYGRIDFNIPLGTNMWFNGDFNYDGKIDISDYGIIDGNIPIQGSQL